MNTTMKHFVAVALVALAATTAQAHSWRINNDVTKAPDFIDLNAAMASENVADGDTLYLDAGANLSAEQNVTKQVTIIGVGYDATLPYGFSTISGAFNLKKAGIKAEGLNITSTTTIAADYVTLERCRTYRIIASGTCQYATIRQCYARCDQAGGTIVGHGKTDTRSAYWTIENCIIIKTNYSDAAIYRLYSAVIRNNLIQNHVSYSNYCLNELGNASVSNNIILDTGDRNYCIGSIDGQFVNNVVGEDYNAETNRVTGSTKTDVVYTGDYESYTLVEDSPAKNYGTDGKDCGIFGGLYPYVKGGLPQGHPYYTKAVISPRAENDKVNVSLKIKMQDE